MADTPVDDQTIEKYMAEEQAARERLQEALRSSPLAQPESPVATPEVQPPPSKEKPARKTEPSEEQEERPHTHRDEGIPGITFRKTTDKNTLVDVHVSNPLKRVIELLEDIKKQKAFSFTLRGSLGIMGVILTLSVFGLFGGNQILCDKGLQTRTGTLRVLQLTEEATDPSIPWSKAMLQKLFFLTPTTLRQRVVLLSPSEPPLHINTLIKHKLEGLNNNQVILTGTLNSCSSSLTVRNEASVEAM